MDHVNVNRVSLTALGAVLFVMLLTAFSILVMSPRTPKVPGFALPTSGPAAATAEAPKAAPEPPLPPLLAKAEVKKGEEDVKVCETCHNFKEGAGAKIGPDLWNVVGRPVASFPGFTYSDALKKIGGDWTYEKLNTWITNPQAMAPGTKMAFAGEKNPQKRADILDYLHTLSDKPVPLPTK
jgi:cytochrome c